PGGGYRPASPEGAAWAAGGTTFAGVLLLLNGVLAMFQGIAAIVEDDVYARIGDYVYEVSLIGWGWILLVLGIVAAVVGWGILTGREWARATVTVNGVDGASVLALMALGLGKGETIHVTASGPQAAEAM